MQQKRGESRISLALFIYFKSSTIEFARLYNFFLKAAQLEEILEKLQESKYEIENMAQSMVDSERTVEIKKAHLNKCRTELLQAKEMEELEERRKQTIREISFVTIEMCQRRVDEAKADVTKIEEAMEELALQKEKHEEKV
jgi:chromosome segregation ATPase